MADQGRGGIREGPARGEAGPRRQLTLFDCAGLIVGIVIGAGIYESTPVVARNAADPGLFLFLWLAGALVAVVGALCYAELASTFPEEGGDYVFLSRAYGPRTAFLFSWMVFWVVRPANIGALALIFARYAGEILPPGAGPYGLVLYAAGAVVVLSLVNITGVRRGKGTQNVLTIIKVAGLVAVGVVALALAPDSPRAAPDLVGGAGDLGLAIILVLFSYGGWRNISFVAAEVEAPERNIVRALLLSTALIAAVYLLVNVAFIRVLGFEGVASSPAVASEVIQVVTGEAGAIFISALICITCLGNINGLIFTNSRIYYATGRDYRALGWLGRWSARLDAPVSALVVQAVVTLLLLVIVGTNTDAFSRLVAMSAPVHWFFSLLVAIALFVLRRREPSRPGFRVPLYPVIPALFCLSTFVMFLAGVTYAVENRHDEAWWILALLVIGTWLAFRLRPREGI